ncbi:Syndecan [Trichostrongylus colubriformis]|uniref:Syndecan n=1 Tax=Trichostrongylus colubriformis TaxID=6319 RepID=A0AAN8IX52_TRICO
MRLLLVVLIGYVAAANNTASINKRAIDGAIHTIKTSEIIEGSGDESGLKHSISLTDTEIHGSGYGSDDEDGDSVHGSGTSMVDVIEGSGGLPPMIHQRPQVTTTTTTTHMPPVHSDTEHVFNPVVPIRQLPKDTLTTQQSPVRTTTTTSSTSTRRIAIQPATTPDPTATQSPFHPVLKPGIFAAIVGGTVVGLLTAILLVMFIVYRMRKKDEGSYALEEPKPRPYAGYAYTKASTKEFYA